MKKVKFLKNHIGHSKGEETELEISQDRLDYWCRVGVCEDLGEVSSDNSGFDPVARKKELMKLKRPALNNVGASHELDPLSYKKKKALVDAIVKEETPVIVPEEVEKVDKIDNEDLVNGSDNSEEE